MVLLLFTYINCTKVYQMYIIYIGNLFCSPIAYRQQLTHWPLAIGFPLLWSRTPTSIMNSVIFFIFFSVFPLFKQDLRLGSLQRIIFVLIVISIDTYQNEIIFKDSRLKCHKNINVQKNNIYFRYKHIYKNIYRYIDRYIIEYD